jgi:hypothetical protein
MNGEVGSSFLSSGKGRILIFLHENLLIGRIISLKTINGF